jgi:flagellar motor switch protein FliN
MQNWLLGKVADSLAAAVEGVTGERPSVDCVPEPASQPAGTQDPIRWRQAFTGLAGAIWLVAEEDAWRALGGAVLKAAQIEEPGEAETGRTRLRSEYLEIVRQAAPWVAQALSERAAAEVTPASGEQLNVMGEAAWGAVEIKLPDRVARLAIGVDAALSAALAGLASRELAVAPEKSKTFDLLLDVELPVSVSFGRAQVLLKDVLKLNVGSIIELNRKIGDPVEVIVNNCVIARGEVVVVEGNFGVRIQNVISRQERLRTLD